MFVSSKEASKYYKVTGTTLRRWADEGKIEFKRTEGNHRKFKIEENEESINLKKNIIYARVSSSKQEEDLQRQIALLKTAYPEYEVISDIGSGINFERKGFRKLLEQVFSGNIEKIAITYKDRLTRFGFDLLEWICQKHGVEFMVMSNTENKEREQELAEDLMSIITVFTSRYYGRGSNKNKENKNLPNPET